MREVDPAWRNRDLPPSPLQAYEQAKIISYLDRGGNIDETRMSGMRGQTFLIASVIANNESLCAELLKRGAAGAQSPLEHIWRVCR